MSFDVAPGKRLGPFVLGMPIGAAIRHLQEHERTISQVELQFDAEHMLDSDICLDLKEECVRLHFDSSLQTMRMIHVYDVSRVRLSYEGRAFTGHRAPEPTLLALYGTFGPSYPGTLDHERSCYHLNYPGVGFVFPIPAQYTGLYASGSTEAPVELPDGSMPLASELFLFRGKSLMEPQVVSLAKITHALPNCRHYFEPVALHPGKGLQFVSRNASLPLGCGPQDVISLLGAPDRQHCKRENKLKIHSERSSPPSSGRASPGPAASQDYFYNYFALGLDILFDGGDHRAVKFVVHSNFPTHDSFNQYSKCNWSIPLEGRNEVIVTADCRWSDVRDHLGIPITVKPVVYNRASDERDISRRTSEQVAVSGAPGVASGASAGTHSTGTSPTGPGLTTTTMMMSLSGSHNAPSAGGAAAAGAGGVAPAHFSTCFYGRQGIIVEVMKNDLIETVILF